MYLSAVNITNFRSFKNFSALLKPGFNVLVGRNNIGKTNFLDAIRHAIGPAGARSEVLWIDIDDFYKSPVYFKRAETISITLTFEGLNETQRSTFFKIVDFNLADLSKSKAILNFEANWPEGKRSANINRWGGSESIDRTPVSAQILELLSVTFLTALRDAEAALAPGVKNRLALLLSGKIKSEEHITGIKEIFHTANRQLENHSLIDEVKKSLQERTKQVAGNDYVPSTIRASEINIDRILRTLSLQMESGIIGDLSANGLGYNNLLYMAVILEHLNNLNIEECPLLLVEEPEAHLHPQLTMLLAEYLAKTNTNFGTVPQTIVTTHSPTLVASIPPSCVHALFTDGIKKEPRCNSITKASLDPTEEMALQRMLDITRATLYFAKGVILVEGLSESLLFPVLARQLNLNLAENHISVIPICGVSFNIFKKLFHPDVLGIPIAIVTDADPLVTREDNWEKDIPEKDDHGNFKVSDRTRSLLQLFEKHETVKVFSSKVTLEYDLAEAGNNNANIMAEIWEQCFPSQQPQTFNAQRLALARDDIKEKALCAWRGICRASHSGSKAEFAQRLANRLVDPKHPKEKEFFKIPEYIENAIKFVINKATS